MNSRRTKPSDLFVISVLVGLCGLSLVLAACGGPSAHGKQAGAGGALDKVQFLGDSVGELEALPMQAAFRASSVDFQSLAAAGGGNVVGPFASKQWPAFTTDIASFAPDVLVYQITTYDWATPAKQEAAYRRLLHTVTESGGELVFVTMPPIRVESFYRPHMAELKHATVAAEKVVKESSGDATLLDADAVWGPKYRQDRDGIPDRSSDGIHVCPQGAARFTEWLLTELAVLYPGFKPAPPSSWANDGWSSSDKFQGC